MPKSKIIGESLFPWQLDFFKLYDSHPKNSIITIKSPRQRAKTHTLTNLVMRQCINNKKYTSIIICPTFQICRKQFKEYDNAFKDVPNLIKSSNSSYFEIELSNGSVIKLKSAESKNNLRGETANLLIFDEAAFIDMNTALECYNYTNTTGGNIILASTPTFEDDTNLFYKYYKAAVDGERGCYMIDFCDYDTSSLMPLSKMELYKKTMPYQVYLNEILGQFLTTKSSLWDFGKVLRNNVLPDNNLIAGIDFATGVNNDETAVAVINSNKQMTHLYHFNDKDTTETINFISNIIKELGIKKIVLEVNSMGKPMRDLLAKEISKKGIRCQLIDFQTTNKTKRDIIESLQIEIQNQTCTLLDEHQLKIEFAQFEIKTTPSGLITYGNSSDSVHDDIVIATALAHYGMKQGKYVIR